MTLLTFSFLLALNFLSCSTVSGRWILYAYLSLSCTHTGKKDGKLEHTHILDVMMKVTAEPSRQSDESRGEAAVQREFEMFGF